MALLLALLLWQPALAQAQAATPEADSCETCHENLYYLHDTGKWYCQCAVPPSCAHCHGGQPQAAAEAAAHAGMIANPLQDGAAVCQTCHPDAYQARVDKFVLLAGGTVTDHAAPLMLGASETPSAATVDRYRLPARLGEPWRLVGLGVTATAMLGLAFVGWYDNRPGRHSV
jgi:hypothetical protein